ncbi:hypothetical protein N8482_01305 [Chitinophagales bacterium]|nr:hypothetical protein [Chitinophagales bacterium]
MKHGIWKYSFNGDPIWTAQFVEGKMISQRADYRNGDQLHIESFLSSTGQITFTVFYLTGEVKYKGVVDTDWSFIRFIFYDKEGKQLPPRFNYYWELLSAEHLVALLMMD